MTHGPPRQGLVGSPLSPGVLGILLFETRLHDGIQTVKQHTHTHTLLPRASDKQTLWAGLQICLSMLRGIKSLFSKRCGVAPVACNSRTFLGSLRMSPFEARWKEIRPSVGCLSVGSCLKGEKREPCLQVPFSLPRAPFGLSSEDNLRTALSRLFKRPKKKSKCVNLSKCSSCDPVLSRYPRISSASTPL